MMTKTGMLIVTNPNKFIRYVARIQREVQKTLYVQVLPEKLKFDNVISKSKLIGPHFSSLITSLYSDAVSARTLDIRILLSSFKDSVYKITTKNPVEVVYFDGQCNEEMMKVLDRVENRSRDCRVVWLEEASLSVQPVKLDSNSLTVYDQVVLGGTFDRLHNGHKTLLTQAVLRCNKMVTVGVTNTDMLKSKKLWELIEPCETRMRNVEDFLKDVYPGLQYDIVPIADMYGPTKDNPHFQMLVVSSETLKGSVKVNQVRAENGLKALDVTSVDLLPDTKLDEVEEDKISSSNDRLRLLGTILKPPKEPTGLPKWPYIIGLTGGIGSGKSSVGKRLENLGAGVVNCDLVAHDIYKAGQPGHSVIVNRFGGEILNENGEIDRKKLGSIVFSDKIKLRELNELLWPLILDKVLVMTRELHEKDGKQVVVLEAALLLDAGWQDACHQVWACIVPRDEAIRRIMERNQLSEEEAVKRLLSQRSNTEYVTGANVVFCTLWDPDYTQKQVERAWKHLSEILSDR